MTFEINTDGIVSVHAKDLELFHWCETAEEAWDHIARFYKIEDPVDEAFD